MKVRIATFIFWLILMPGVIEQGVSCNAFHRRWLHPHDHRRLA
jgi:hypothetical protein